MNPTHTLPTTPFAHPAMDYAWLRATAIRQLERLAGGRWTDFNAHDPGITILEQFCYALTDLSYRIDYDLKDLLTGSEAEPYRALFTPAAILTTNPVTLTDLRKVVLDVAGVRNAWIEPLETVTPALYYDPADQSLYLQEDTQRQPLALRGLYQVRIEADGSVDGVTLVNAVSRRLHACRNLGETFDPPRILPQQPITVVATLEVGAAEDPDQLLATIYQRLADFLSPRVRFYTLAELLAQGQRIDEIMDGPRLEHGFIRSAELAAVAHKRAGLRTSDLIQELMNVAGVRAVNMISLWADDKEAAWYLSLDPTRTPVLVMDQSRLPHPAQNKDQPAIQLTRNGIRLRSDFGRVKHIFAQLQQADRAAPQPAAERDVRLPPGRDRHVGHYHSIQQQLPALYGLGALGLPPSASAARQAQAKQLQAYLLFFDQLLANAFAQVAHVKDLFVFDAPVGDTAPQTYFTQLLDDPALGLTDIWMTADANARAVDLQTKTEDPNTALTRKNRFLNHLLARFGETFTDFDVADAAPARLSVAKAAFLQAYPALSAARGRAFNTALPTAANDASNCSALEKRINHKLGLAALLPSDADRFYLVEHILLRPDPADAAATALVPGEVGWQAGVLLALPEVANQPVRPDPYSLQLSLVFPAWIERFQTAEFKHLLAQTLREETPAHLALQLLWLTQNEMASFAAAYQRWQATLTPTMADPDRLQARVARDQVIDWLGLGTPYPLRDLPLDYVAMVAVEQPAAIQLRHAQQGVAYQLCDEEGNPLALAQAAPITVGRDATATMVTLTTPGITLDRTFTILATRTHTVRGNKLPFPLESYLKQSISIKAGINTALEVAFWVGEQPLNPDNPAPIAYNATLKVVIERSQAGIQYELVDANGLSLSASQAGDQEAPIELHSKSLPEDTTINIKAYRPSTSDKPSAPDKPSASNTALLKSVLAVQVQPNPAVQVQVAAPIVDYPGTATLTLDKAQASVTYQLYQHRVTATEYATDDHAVGTLTVAGNEGHPIYIKAPPPISNWNNPAPFALGKEFSPAATSAPTVTLTDLHEDTYVIVRATKTVNQSSLSLAQAVVILVRPDPAPLVGAEQSSIPKDSEGVVTVTGTQQGVAYQLLAEDSPVNAPGYDYRDRAIETTRIEVDFVVEAPADATAYQTLRLPTGVLTNETTFTVQATKVRTGLRARLTEGVTIDIIPPSPSPTTEPTPPPTPPVALAQDVPTADSNPLPAAGDSAGRSTDARSTPAALVDPPVDEALPTPNAQKLEQDGNSPTPAALIPQEVMSSASDADTGPEVSPEKAVVDFDQATYIRIKASRAREWYQLWLAGAPLGKAVKGTGRDRLLETPTLRADAHFELHITQPTADPPVEERVLAVVVLVRPNPTLAVSTVATTVAANTDTAIQVAASQVGVQYQLLAGGQPVGEPVAGTGTAITLSTGLLTAETTFTIRATRLDQPDLAVDLAQVVTVQVA